MVKEFVAFLKRGNVLDLAVAVIIGRAFGKIVTSLVSDIIMPVVSLATGGISMKKKEESAPAAPPDPSAEETLLTEIRDLLKSGR